MIMDTLMLRRYFYTTLEYNDLKTRLKRRFGANFKLGFIDYDEISLYYLKDWYTERRTDQVPFCQMEVRNKREEDGRIRIRFRVATFALIAVAFLPVFFMVIFYFRNAPIPLYYPLTLYPVLYFFLQVGMSKQADRFESDLRRLETETI
jgi:hypothetical protein